MKYKNRILKIIVGSFFFIVGLFPAFDDKMVLLFPGINPGIVLLSIYLTAYLIVGGDVVLKAVKNKFITIEYPDPEEGKQMSKTFYVGDRTAPSYSWNNKFEKAKWNGLSMNFIER